ncbi:MAG: methyltransferase domain-containing protein [Patescibacteria group bacterium]
MKKLKKVIVNLGCGKVKIPGAIGLDRVKIDGYVDIVHDLDEVPYPFKKDSVDEIHFYHVLEHLHDPIRKLEEIHRILKPGGLLHMRVPHFSSMGAFTDLTHIRPFGYYSFDCLESDNYQHFYTTVSFKIQKKEIKYLGMYPNDGIYAKYVHPNQCHILARPFVRLLNYLIKLSPTAFERIWCYWVGGATEVVVTLEKV